jgi:hypothetical protein
MCYLQANTCQVHHNLLHVQQADVHLTGIMRCVQEIMLRMQVVMLCMQAVMLRM